MKSEKFENVWDAIANSPGEAAALKLRSDLMSKIEAVVAGWKLPQGQAAKRLGITRPRLNDLLRGKLSKFSLDALASLAVKAGLRVKLSVSRAA